MSIAPKLNAAADADRQGVPVTAIERHRRAATAAWLFASRIRDNLARLADEPDVQGTLARIACGTWSTAERIVDATAILEEQAALDDAAIYNGAPPQVRAWARNVRNALSYLSAHPDLPRRLTDSMEGTMAMASHLVKELEPVFGWPEPEPDTPPFDLEDVSQRIATRVTEILAAEPVLGLLRAARAWDAALDEDAEDERVLATLALKMAIQACNRIDPNRRPVAAEV